MMLALQPRALHLEHPRHFLLSNPSLLHKLAVAASLHLPWRDIRAHAQEGREARDAVLRHLKVLVRDYSANLWRALKGALIVAESASDLHNPTKRWFKRG